jgi:putative transcriptional regulator
MLLNKLVIGNVGRASQGGGVMRTNLAKAVGGFVSSHRFVARLTQTELAERIGVSRQTIAMIENGQQMPGWETLYSLADAFNVEAWSLLPSRRDVKKPR